jgi:hypothetical protein
MEKVEPIGGLVLAGYPHLSYQGRRRFSVHLPFALNMEYKTFYAQRLHELLQKMLTLTMYISVACQTEFPQTVARTPSS